MTVPQEVRLARHAGDLDENGHDIYASAPASGTGFDITPALSNALPPWVGPSGSGIITPDPQGRIGLMTGTGYKSFPGMTYLEGRLHLVYRYGTAHNSAGAEIDYKWSDDLGQTWQPAGTATTLVGASGPNDVRDPTIVALSSGRLLVTFDRRNPYSSTNIAVHVMYSDDRGQSWSSEYIVPAVLSGSEAAATSQPIELPDGTILLPGTIENGGPLLSVVWISTDGGLTFPTQVEIASHASREYTEPQIRYLASGTLVCLMRSDTTQHTYRSVSTDLGATWSAPADVLTASSRPDFVEFYPGALLGFFRNNNSQFYARWTVSWDEGATWTALQDVDGATDLSMYAAPVVLAPGYVIVAYSLENSASDADLYVRYYYDGYGTDVLGNVRALSVSPGGAPSTVDYLVGTASGDLSAEIVVGTTPGGELGGTWASPTVDTTHSGSSHAATQAAAEATAAAALAAHVASSGTGAADHAHVVGETHLADGSTTTWTLDQAFQDGSVTAWNTTTLARLGVTEVPPDQATVSAAGSSGDSMVFDYAAVVA